MLDFNEEIPFFWRLSEESADGFSHVSMVIPFQTGSENLEHTIPTSVVSFSGDFEKSGGEETLEWNEDDIQLFLKLLAARQAAQIHDKPEFQIQTFKVDLTDPTTIEIVNIVAAAGFGMTMQVDDLLITNPGDTQRSDLEVEIGSDITLNTIDGYKRGIVVAINEDDEVVCVLLDRIALSISSFGDDVKLNLGMDDIHPHDLVIVKNHQLLPAYYSSLAPAATDILH